MGGVYYSMKAEFKDNSALVVTVYLIISVSLLGFAIRIGERPSIIKYIKIIPFN